MNLRKPLIVHIYWWQILLFLMASVILSTIAVVLLISKKDRIESYAVETLRNSIGNQIKTYSNINVALPMPPVGVEVQQNPLNMQFKILDQLPIHIKDQFVVPVNIKTVIPFDTPVALAGTIPIDMPIRISQELNEKNLQVNDLNIELDSEIHIKDEIPISQTIPVKLQTRVFGIPIKIDTTMPIDMVVPIDKSFKFSGQFPVKVGKFAGQLNLNVPIKTSIDLKQPIRVKGKIPVQFSQQMTVPVDKQFVFKFKDKLNGQAFMGQGQHIPVKIHGAYMNLQDFIDNNKGLPGLKELFITPSNPSTQSN